MKVFVIIPAAGLGTRMSAGAKKGPRPSKQFTELGGTPLGGSPAAFGTIISEATEKWAKVIKFAGIKTE